MTPFLQQIATYIATEFRDGFDKVCIVLPNRRGGLFLRKYLAAEVGKATWAPSIFSIEDFIAEISGLQEVENIHLLFELYEVHREIEGAKAHPFEEFLRWAPQLINDFNDVDRYLADPEELFTTLTEARAISIWNLDNHPLTEFEKNYLHFYQSLFAYYDRLKNRLLIKNQAYQGLNFRHVAENIETFQNQLPWQHLLFAGFNALTKAEERIIDTLVKSGKASLRWDADHFYLDNKQQEAGDFLRGWMHTWPLKAQDQVSGDFAGSSKTIDIIGSPDPIGQVRYGSAILQELARNGMDNEKTAVVLLDEGLLLPMLHAIPGEVGALNITAGLPLKQTPLAHLFETVFRLHLNMERFTGLSIGKKGKYYYRDVLKLLQHPYIHWMANRLMDENRSAFDKTFDKIRQGTKVFIGMDDLNAEKPTLFETRFPFLETIFVDWEHPSDVLGCFRSLLENLRMSVMKMPPEDGIYPSRDQLELEYLFAFSKLVHQLSDRLTAFPVDIKIPVFYQLFEQMVEAVNLPFYGEPLRGVQLMGMLETRTLDFDNLIILSCNEDLLPGGKITNSFIPFDIKRSFGLPTYRHKDSVYAYHFYRLIQRAKNIHILYNTEPDQLGGGEPSRFLRQIIQELPRYNPLIRIREMIVALPAIQGASPPVIEIQKSAEIQRLLEAKATKGFSATSLNAYRNCSLKFYYAEIAGIREPEEKDDTIDPVIMGSAVHEALHALFKPFIGQAMAAGILQEMEKKSDDAVDRAFQKKFKGSGLSYGKNLLLVTVAKIMVKRYLQSETKRVEGMEREGASFSVAFLEQYVEYHINIPYGEMEIPVRLKGILDRVDAMAGSWRIIDYKTGATDPKQVKIKAWENLIDDPGLNIGFQLLLYSFLLHKRYRNPGRYGAGIFPLRKIGDGFLSVKVPGETDAGQSDINDPELDHFENVLRNILCNIYNLSEPFVQTKDLTICQYCPYINLCGR